jgi:hypothetical protein
MAATPPKQSVPHLAIKRGERGGATCRPRPTIKHIFLAAALLFPLPAVAGECPTVANLERGIVLERAKPFFRETFRMTDSGLIGAREMNRGNGIEKVQSTFAHALAITSRESKNSRLTIEHDREVAPLNRLDEIKEFSSKTALRINGGAPISGNISWRFLGRSPVKVGNCTYESWVVMEDAAYTSQPSNPFQQYYVPALGLILESVKLDASGQPISGVAFDSIRASEEP